MNKLRENDLVVPVLEFMRLNGGSATIREIRDYIIANYPLSDIDLQMSATRRNEHIFEQQIRNLTSHRKLDRLGLAETVAGGFRLLPGVAELLENSSDWVYDLLSHNYKDDYVCREVASADPRRRKVVVDESQEAGEGMVVTTARETKRRTRSALLRSAAIQRFSNDGHIACSCCGLDFAVKYGPEFADSCIEIHHKKPIYMYDDDDMNLTIADAIDNLVPLCPNCHRVVHRYKLFSEEDLARLRDIIARNSGQYGH